MPRCSKHFYLLQHLREVTSHLWLTTGVALLEEEVHGMAEDGSDVGLLIALEAAMGITYAAVLMSRYCFQPTLYHKPSSLKHIMPEWQKIVHGYKYNDEQFVSHFHIMCPLFHHLVHMVWNHPAFCCGPENLRQC
jgi:hypothetical protein